MENILKISERMIEFMVVQEIDNKTLAKNIGVSESTVSRWKSSSKYMFLSGALKLADYFKCSLDFLVGRCENVIDFTPQICPPFYERLREIMELKGITRYELNQKTRIKSSHFVDWKKGSDPYILSLIELADYLDITLDYLVGREK